MFDNNNLSNTTKALLCFVFLMFVIIICEINIFKSFKQEVSDSFETIQEDASLWDRQIVELKEKNITLEESFEAKIVEKDEEIEGLQVQIGMLETQIIELEAKMQGPASYPGILSKASGVAYYDGHRETWYNLDMSTIVSIAHDRGIEGEYWIREDGAKMLGDYIMIAADQNVHPYGSHVDVSMGTGVVVDTGSFIYSDPYQIDVAVAW